MAAVHAPVHDRQDHHRYIAQGLTDTEAAITIFPVRSSGLKPLHQGASGSTEYLAEKASHLALKTNKRRFMRTSKMVIPKSTKKHWYSSWVSASFTRNA